MKKKTTAILLIVVSVAVMVLAFYVVAVQYGTFSIGHDGMKLNMIQGGYRSWSISWSFGLQMLDDGRYKNIWRFPRFYRCDVRGLLLSQESEDEKTNNDK